MGEISDFALKDLDLTHKVILDAAVGAAEATRDWARQVHEQGGTSRIISVDNDLDDEWHARIHERLGEYDRYVELHAADIFDLDFLRDGSIDIVNCDDTVVFLNDRPLHLLSALREFDRVLRSAGLLVITSETPVRLEDGPDSEGQWRRWQFAKALWNLKGETWSTEPLSGDVERALELLGYDIYDRKEFPARRPSTSPKVCIDEWQGIMLKEIETLPWPDLREPLRQTVHEVHAKVMSDGYIMTPPYYVLKCRKPG
jgi:SAM-dependent methyltransferase